MITSSSFVIKLIKLQKKLRLSDQKFAEQLRIARSSWTLVRLGNAGIGITLLAGVASAYPILEQDILEYLRGRNGH